MNSWRWSRNNISTRLLVCLAVFIAVLSFVIYRYAGNSLPAGGEESLQHGGENPATDLNEVNQELSARISRLQEELRLITEERDRLKEDKTQLLYMVDKLQQQSMKPAARGQKSGASEKVVRSWLVRLSELSNVKIPETAAPRDAYVKEVNEVVRGLKEDFPSDTFIMGIGYAKTSSRGKSDINAARQKLDDIMRYLSAYDYGTG